MSNELKTSKYSLMFFYIPAPIIVNIFMRLLPNSKLSQFSFSTLLVGISFILSSFFSLVYGSIALIDHSTIFLYLLPVILVSGTLKLNKKAISMRMFSILFLGFFATGIAFLMIKWASYSFSGAFFYMKGDNESITRKLSNYFSNILGSSLSAIDPVILFSTLSTGDNVFSELPIAVLSGESLVNDVLGLIIFEQAGGAESFFATIYSSLLDKTQSTDTDGNFTVALDKRSHIFLKVLWVFFLSGMIGLLFGLSSSFFLVLYGHALNPKTQIAVVFLQMYLPYILSDLLQASGIFSLVISALVTSAYSLPILPVASEELIRNILELFNDLAETLLMCTLGAAAGQCVRMFKNFYLVCLFCVLIVTLLSARILGVVLVCTLSNILFRTGYGKKELALFFACSARGAASLAMGEAFLKESDILEKIRMDNFTIDEKTGAVTNGPSTIFVEIGNIIISIKSVYCLIVMCTFVSVMISEYLLKATKNMWENERSLSIEKKDEGKFVKWIKEYLNKKIFGNVFGNRIYEKKLEGV